MEEKCSFEEAREVFENTEKTVSISTKYPSDTEQKIVNLLKREKLLIVIFKYLSLYICVCIINGIKEKESNPKHFKCHH